MQEADYELGTSQLSDLHTYTGKIADGLTTVQMPKMWRANNAQYYSTIHSLRLTSIQAVSVVWLGTEVDSPDDNIILRPPGADGTFAEISSYTSRFAIAAFRSLVSNSESHTTIYNTVKILIIGSWFSSAWIPYVQCIPFCRVREQQVNKGRIELGAQVTVSSFLPCEQRLFELI